MTAIATPRTLEQATAIAERYALLDGQIAAIEADRQASIAAVNARCDVAANDLIAQRAVIEAKLKPWWEKNSDKLTEGKRKSIELGGCIIGSRAGKPSLGLIGKEDAAVAKLQKLPWAAGLLKTKTTLDRVAVLKALATDLGKSLRRMGFGVVPGEEKFLLERAEQGGTLGSQ